MFTVTYKYNRECFHCLLQVVDIFVENFNLYQAGKPLKYVVDWSKEY